MIRDSRNKFNEETGNKIIKYLAIAVGVLAVIVIAIFIYSASLENEEKQGSLSSEQMASLTNLSNESDSEEASIDIGKSVNEAKNEIGNTVTNTSTNTNSNNNTNNTTKNTENNKTKTENTSNSNTITTNANETSKTNEIEKQTNTAKEETKTVELSFQKPVEGEIVKEFAKDNLIFSETLQEWTVHTGIDIKADKTTVVKSAEAGTVKSIKNDPRYGLTIVVEHENGFETVYSNLLTSEFVVENEKVEKGQSLGTVGNTAVFESADEPHLHFEILKDSIQVDPSIYINN